jgi:hypothetical protein
MKGVSPRTTSLITSGIMVDNVDRPAWIEDVAVTDGCISKRGQLLN